MLLFGVLRFVVRWCAVPAVRVCVCVFHFL
jgi:hypothetical protein